MTQTKRFRGMRKQLMIVDLQAVATVSKHRRGVKIEGLGQASCEGLYP
jgi:hypothetical protein